MADRRCQSQNGADIAPLQIFNVEADDVYENAIICGQQRESKGKAHILSP